MKKKAKTWHAVTANYKSIHLNKPRRRNLWEQITFLIQADGLEEAKVIGQEVAKSKEHAYQTVSGDQLTWILIEVVEVKELIDQEIKQGIEVDWHFFERLDKKESGD